MAMLDFDLHEFIARARHIGSDIADVEVKTAQGGLPKDILATISAFSNTTGGWIVLGLSEEQGFKPVSGFDAKKISEALAQACAEKLEPPIRPSIDIQFIDQSPVVVARIPELEPYLKPCCIKARGSYDGSFIRVGEGDRRLSYYEVDRIKENKNQPSFDLEVVQQASMDDFDEELLNAFLSRLRTLSPRVFSKLSNEKALLSMHVIARDESGEIHPTLAGLMALGLHPQEFFPRCCLSFAAYPGRSKADSTINGKRFLDSQSLIGPIPVMISDALALIRKNMKVSTYFHGASRIDVPEFPELALREAIANALMHRDYSPQGRASQVQVNMFEDRIEILNPGGLYGSVTIDNLGEYGISSSRNLYLSKVLENTSYAAGYPETGVIVENKGTGYEQIQHELQDHGLPPAKPVDSLSFFALEIYKKQVYQQTGNSQSLPQNLDIKILNETKLSENDRVYDLILTNGSTSTSEVSEALGISKATAFRKLKCLTNEGKLQSNGRRGRSTRYYFA